jgi:hypothetical protein
VPTLLELGVGDAEMGSAGVGGDMGLLRSQSGRSTAMR